jgi:hypothetical protein
VEVFTPSANLPDLEPDSSQSINILSEMRLQSCQNPVLVKALLREMIILSSSTIKIKGQRFATSNRSFSQAELGA